MSGASVGQTATADGETRPLFVDLDDTLVEGDTLWESLVLMTRRNPKGLLSVAASLPRGRVAFKKAVAENVEVSAADFRLNQGVLSFVSDAQGTRPVILATAANARIADKIADDLGLFDAVLATRDEENLKSGNKLAAIQDYLSTNGLGESFDYVGDCAPDRKLWRAAGRAHVVCADEAKAAAIADDMPVHRHFARPGLGAHNLWAAMRPHQWVKNLLIFLPVILAHQVFEPLKMAQAITAFLAFSLTASATYLWNDILDIEADRRHPTKRNRPFAASLVPLPLGVAASLVLLAVASVLVLFVCPPITIWALLGYVLITLSYSLYFKRRLMIDVVILGSLYGYRVMFGGLATETPVSSWLVGFSVFFFFGLALIKRYTEIDTKTPDTDGRIGARGYFAGDREVVGVIGIVASMTSVLILALYITSPAVAVLYSRPEPLWTVCLVLIYWTSRLWVLAHRAELPDDPILFALKDRNSLVSGAVCAAAVLAAI